MLLAVTRSRTTCWYDTASIDCALAPLALEPVFVGLLGAAAAAAAGTHSEMSREHFIQ